MKSLKKKVVVDIKGTLTGMLVGEQCEFSALKENSVRPTISRLKKGGVSFSVERKGSKIVVTRIK